MSCSNNNLYIISFIVGSDSGLAFLSAPSEVVAIQTLRNSGKWNGTPDAYKILQCRNIGMATTIRNELLLESYVNALVAYDAIVSSVDRYVGPKGDKGDKGDPGPMMFDSVAVTVDENTGNPSVDVTPIGTPGVDGKLKLDFHGLKGKTGTSITGIEQTKESSLDGGVNEFTISLDNGSSKKVRFRNGRVGVTSVSANVSSLPGTPEVVTHIDDGELTFYFYGIKGEQGEPGKNNTSMSIVTELPTASAQNMDKIYLMYNSTSGKYDIYFVQTNGSSYSYVQAGSISVDLDDYIRKDSDVWLTQAEFDALPIKDITKTYNIYEEDDGIDVSTGSGSGYSVSNSNQSA